MNIAAMIETLPPAVLMGVPLFLAFALLIFAFAGDGNRRLAEKRIRSVRQRYAGDAEVSATVDTTMSVRREKADSRNPLFDRFIKRFIPRRAELRHRLDRAGIGASIGRYVVISCGVGMVIALASFLLISPNPALALLFGIAAGSLLPHMVVGMMATRRRKKFLNDFPDAIDLMTRGLKSGLPITESMRTASEEVADPVGTELAAIIHAIRLGSKMEEALWDAARRLDIQEFNFFAISLSIQAETGGNLSETLSNLSDVLRKRRQLKLKIKALSSEAKASAYIIGALPFIMSGIIYMMNPDYMITLFTDPRGMIMIGIGLTSFLIGALVMAKMVRFDY